MPAEAPLPASATGIRVDMAPRQPSMVVAPVMDAGPSVIVGSPTQRETIVTVTPLTDISYDNTTASTLFGITPEKNYPPEIPRLPEFYLPHIPTSRERIKVIGDRGDLVETAAHEDQHAYVAGYGRVMSIEMNPLSDGSLARTWLAGVDSVSAAASGVATPFGGPKGTGGDEAIVNWFGDSWSSSVNAAASKLGKLPMEVRAKKAEMIAYMYLKTGGAIPGSMLAAIHERAVQEYNLESTLAGSNFTIDDLISIDHEKAGKSLELWNQEVANIKRPQFSRRDSLFPDGSHRVEIFSDQTLISTEIYNTCPICGAREGSAHIREKHIQSGASFGSEISTTPVTDYQVATPTQPMAENSAQNAESMADVTATGPIADYNPPTATTGDIFIRDSSPENQTEAMLDPAASGLFGQSTYIIDSEKSLTDEDSPSSQIMTNNNEPPENVKPRRGSALIDEEQKVGSVYAY